MVNTNIHTTSHHMHEHAHTIITHSSNSTKDELHYTFPVLYHIQTRVRPIRNYLTNGGNRWHCGLRVSLLVSVVLHPIRLLVCVRAFVWEKRNCLLIICLQRNFEYTWTMPPKVPTRVVVHPIVLLSVVDHFNRLRKIGNQKRVVGVLLGTWRANGVVDIATSYAGIFPCVGLWYSLYPQLICFHLLCSPI